MGKQSKSSQKKSSQLGIEDTWILVVEFEDFYRNYTKATRVAYASSRKEAARKVEEEITRTFYDVHQFKVVSCEHYPRSVDNMVLAVSNLEQDQQNYSIVEMEGNQASFFGLNNFASKEVAQDFCDDLNESETREHGVHYIVVPTRVRREIVEQEA